MLGKFSAAWFVALLLLGCQPRNSERFTSAGPDCGDLKISKNQVRANLGSVLLGEQVPFRVRLPIESGFGKVPFKVTPSCGCVVADASQQTISGLYTPTIVGPDEQLLNLIDAAGESFSVILVAHVRPRVESDHSSLQIAANESGFWTRKIILTFGKKPSSNVTFQMKDCIIESQKWLDTGKLEVTLQGLGLRPKKGNGYLAIEQEKFFLPIEF